MLALKFRVPYKTNPGCEYQIILFKIEKEKCDFLATSLMSSNIKMRRNG